jgi:galactan 5-O-arabinofuranosyltransferase
VVFPWRGARTKGLALLGFTGVVFGLLTANYLAGLLFDPAGKIADTYVYFDVRTEPLYIASWRNDTPGVLGNWPPFGEIGGMGLYTLLLALGLGAAVAIGRRTTLVIGTTTIMTGAWLMRFFYAKQMWATKLVQLYPRTTPLILYALMVLTGFAVYWLVRRLADDHPLRGRSAVIGAVCTLLLVFASAGSLTADRYMPVNTDPPGGGWLTYNSHATKWGEFPRYKSRALPWLRRPPRR